MFKIKGTKSKDCCYCDQFKLVKDLRKLEINYNRDELINDDYSNNSKNIINLFINLEKLIISGNENIIKLLENVNLKELKELDLSNNKISDIKVLEKVKFDKLEILDISNNKILNLISLIY